MQHMFDPKIAQQEINKIQDESHSIIRDINEGIDKLIEQINPEVDTGTIAELNTLRAELTAAKQSIDSKKPSVKKVRKDAFGANLMFCNEVMAITQDLMVNVVGKCELIEDRIKKQLNSDVQEEKTDGA